MPVTSLPIYGLRNRAGLGGFCHHMANWLWVGGALSQGRTNRGCYGAPGVALGEWERSGSLDPSFHPDPGIAGPRRVGDKGSCSGGEAPPPLLQSPSTEYRRPPAEQSPPATHTYSPGREEFRFPKKGEDPVVPAPPPPGLVWEPFRKIKLRKETQRSRHLLQSNPYSLSWQV